MANMDRNPYLRESLKKKHWGKTKEERKRNMAELKMKDEEHRRKVDEEILLEEQQRKKKEEH